MPMQTTMQTSTQQSKYPKSEKNPFFCPCGNDFFWIGTGGKIIIKDYKKGDKFEAPMLRKSLTCSKCGTRFLDTDVSKSQEELRQIAEFQKANKKKMS